MERFIVSARKYRPATFDTVVGQPSITQTLKNAIRSNHLAQAFLFTGPRGVGKTTTARVLAKTINCENITEQIEACNKCTSCKLFNEGTSLAIYELDAASNNSVEDIRALVDQVRYPPQSGKYKIYIIDEVHMLSAAAFNAFLKTLEEPPSYAIFILATTEKHKIIPTILSRCQIFDFNRISTEDIVNHLSLIASKEGVDAEEDALHVIAQKADGALRDSLSLFDQLVSFAGNHLTYKAVIDNLNILDYEYYFRITDDLLAGNFSSVLLTFDEILNKGFDAHNFINGLASHFRDLLVCKDEITLTLLQVSPNVREKYRVQSKFCEASWLFQMLDLADKADFSFKAAKNHRLHIELTLLKMSSFNQSNQNKKKVDAPATIVTKTETPVKTVVEEKPVTATEKPAAAPPVKKTISISGKNNPVQEKKTEVVTEAPKTSENFDLNTLLFYWQKFADQLKTEGRILLHTAFTKRTPVLEKDFLISFVVDNVAIEKEVNECKTNLLSMLRSSLNNYMTNLKVIVEENPVDNVPYTPKEKFKKLAEKNPVLNDLKNKLDLEIDY